MCGSLRASGPVYHPHRGTASLGQRRHAIGTKHLAWLAHEYRARGIACETRLRVDKCGWDGWVLVRFTRIDRLDVLKRAGPHVLLLLIFQGGRLHEGATIGDVLCENNPALHCLLLPQLTYTTRDGPRLVESKELLPPLSWILGLVDVPPGTEFGCCGGVDFFVQCRAAIVFDAVLDRSHGKNEQKRQHCDLGCSSAEHREHWRDAIFSQRTGAEKWG